MSVNDESTVSRQFVASSIAFSSKWMKGTKYLQAGYAAVFEVFVVFGLLMVAGPSFGVHLRFPRIGPALAYAVPVVLVVAGVGVGVYMFWRSRRKYVITVTSDALSIDGRRGEVYSLVDAQLGLWVNMGVALHLLCGRHRFLLGGRHRRVAPGTPLDAAPVQLVDAWLPESDFDALLSLSGRWSGSAAREPALGEPTRCLLYPNPLLIQQMGSFAFGKKQRLTQSLS